MNIKTYEDAKVIMEDIEQYRYILKGLDGMLFKARNAIEMCDTDIYCSDFCFNGINEPVRVTLYVKLLGSICGVFEERIKELERLFDEM